MAATGDGVRAITGSALDDTALTPFLVAADCVIEDALACGCGATKSQTCLDSAANFLASHFLATSKVGEKTQLVGSEKFENYQVSYKTGTSIKQGILSTNYGQTANTLMGGCLVELDTPAASVGFA
jgi:hypothetical protein